VHIFGVGDEELIFTPEVRKTPGGPMVKFEPYWELKAKSKVGDRFRFGSEEAGFIDYEITRIDETGIYGKILKDTLRTG
jgi:hypothetical protein